MPSMGPAARALLDHPAECCRWPIGDGWCSRKATHGSYCGAHHLASVAAVQHEFSAVVTDMMLRSIVMRLGDRRKRWRRAA